jgi:hypothetical protein
MKTKVEVLGYEIEIEEVDGVVTVKADLDGETVEEFTLEAPEGEEGEGQGDDDVKGFKDFDGQAQEEDFPQDDEESEEEEEDEDDEKETLESFQSFINKK